MNINDLKPYDKNAKKHDEKQIKQVAESIKRFGFVQPLVIDKENTIIIGHCRYEASKILGIEEVKIGQGFAKKGENFIPAILIEDLTEQEIKALRLADNKLNESGWNMDLVVEELKGFDADLVDLTGFDDDILNNNKYDDELRETLVERFLIPPFSIFDTKQGYWQDRKRAWLKYMGDSGEGRSDDLLGKGLKQLAQRGKQGNNYTNGISLTGTSVFDPVLCEIVYSWFAPENSNILDCFAGGFARGIVAGAKKHKYYGVDLSQKQIDVNIAKAKELNLDVNWFYGDSVNIKDIVPEQKYDLLFTCPPYYDLEKYNDGDGDLSMMETYDDFIKIYDDILSKSCDLINDNRFAVIVVTNIRDKKGFYRNFVNDTTSIMKKNGFEFYNDIILANAIATASMRTRGFVNRKVVKIHQNILCFYKGDINEIKNNYNMTDKLVLEEEYDEVETDTIPQN